MIAPLQDRSTSRKLEFGLYRDGDNNLDHVQETTISQARAVSARDGSIEFTVEDTTAQRGFAEGTKLHTDDYQIDDGTLSHVQSDRPHDMSSRANLTQFVARTLDNAEKAGASQTWLDLIDHGGGDGGGLQADHGIGIMRADDIAGAIADGVAQHAKEHPEDTGRHVDGVVANQCLMATLAFSSALSHAGVQYLAASPETMLAPGVPSTVAEDIAQHLDDPSAMANAVVKRTMNTEYGGLGGFAPSAAFDVIDLDPHKTAAVETSVKTLNGALVAASNDASEKAAIREDAKGVDGMVRFPEGNSLPWRADRPAIALYQTFAQDTRLDSTLRHAAADAATAIGATVMAHAESADFAPFNDSDYRDAVGPNVHFPVSHKQIDPWAPQMR
ncbi:MAG TPA: hypothetical protein VGD50_04890, partial [Candidatus Baltobacteraceae bacterium]